MGMAKPAAPVVTDWSHALARACAGQGLRALYQPLVDLRRGLVVGYEALIRFAGADGPGPERWFAAARAQGCEAALEAAALTVTLRARPELPPDTFLSVNVSPTALASAAVAARLDAQGDLRGLVIELTEQTPVDDYDELAIDLDRYRGRGALVAIDDAGSGYAGLTHLLRLRPSILKLDRGLVTDIDRDESKCILVEMLGVYAGHLDAWVLAEGVETRAELETLRRLCVPLGQGYALGRPARPWASLPAPARHALAEAPPTAVDPGGRVGTLREPAVTEPVGDAGRVLAELAGGPADAFVVLVDEHGRPVGGVNPAGARLGRAAPVLSVALATPVTDVAYRALTRPVEQRFEPLAVTDPAGRVVGVVRIERVVERLARAASTSS